MHAAMMSVHFAEPAFTMIAPSQHREPRPPSPPPLPPPPSSRPPTPPPPPPPSPSLRSRRAGSTALSSHHKPLEVALSTISQHNENHLAKHTSQRPASERSLRRQDVAAPQDSKSIYGSYGYTSWAHFGREIPIKNYTTNNECPQRRVLHPLGFGMEPNYRHLLYGHCCCNAHKSMGGRDQSAPPQHASVKALLPPPTAMGRPSSPTGTLGSQTSSHRLTRASAPPEPHTNNAKTAAYGTSNRTRPLKCVECGSPQKPEHDNVKRLPAFGNLPMCWRCAFAQVGNEVGRVWLGNY